MPKLTAYLQQQEPASSSSATHEAVEQEIAGLRQRHERRVRDHGERVFRQLDGSLGPQPPPASPYTVANRRRWHDLVQHARQQEGVIPAYTRAGVCPRYGLGVDEATHARALAALGLSAEVDGQGHWVGFDASQEDPLTDPRHALCQEEWRALTHAILQRAEQVHGQQLLVDAQYADLFQRCS